ncbi:MAG: hypothetical protein M3301_01745, partial [Chloroflexota bacterium]|nr:hypothetical protein [Chloroflexota bacterium]
MTLLTARPAAVATLAVASLLAPVTGAARDARMVTSGGAVTSPGGHPRISPALSHRVTHAAAGPPGL